MNIDGLFAAVAFESFRDHEGVAGAVGDFGEIDFGVLKEDAVVVFQGRLRPRAKEIVGGPAALADALQGILGIETDLQDGAGRGRIGIVGGRLIEIDLLKEVVLFNERQ